VAGGWGDASNREENIVAGEGGSFSRTLPANQFRQRRTTGDRRNATFCLKPDFTDGVVLQKRGQFENVSAGGILELRRSVSAIQHTDIARVLKMIEKLGGIHGSILFPQSGAIPGLGFRLHA